MIAVGLLGIGEGEFVVLQLGRLVPRKGIDNVIRGIAELKRSHGIVARLVVVGSDGAVPDSRLTPEIARLAGIAATEGVSDRVMFVGSRPRSELHRYYNAADVFVSTPWYEPFGITPLEAMACGGTDRRSGLLSWLLLSGPAERSDSPAGARPGRVAVNRITQEREGETRPRGSPPQTAKREAEGRTRPHGKARRRDPSRPAAKPRPTPAAPPPLNIFDTAPDPTPQNPIALDTERRVKRWSRSISRWFDC